MSSVNLDLLLIAIVISASGKFRSSPFSSLNNIFRLSRHWLATMSRKVSIDNINAAIVADDADAPTLENPRKRRKTNTTQTTLLKQVQDRKDLLFLEYRDIFRKKKEDDEAWKWLSSLGIPCHNTSIPVMPHTKAQLHEGSLTTDALKGINLDDVYHAHDITRSIVSRYCDWQISDAVSSAEPTRVERVLQTYRNAARGASFVGSPSRPGYEERPTQSEKPIERCIMQVIRSAAVHFKKPNFCVPLEWKQLPLPALLTLPSLYNKLLAEIAANNGRVPKEEEEGPFSREPSRPLDEITEPHLLDLLKSGVDGNASPSLTEKKKLEVIQKALPVDSTVTRETAYENAQLAQGRVNDLNRPLSLIISRRELAHKLETEHYLGIVNFLDASKIKRLDDLCGFGSVLFNDEPTILAHQTANIALEWANKKGSPPSATETGHEKDVGGLLNWLVISEEIYKSDNGTLSLPSCLQMAGMRPKPDLFSQAEVISCPRLAAVSPVIFAGECKTKKGLTLHTPAQLACALNGTLVLLVLMYLDMRTTAEELLPEWLFVYGIIYTGSGVIIRAHFPTYRHVEEPDMGTEGEHKPQSLSTGNPAKVKRAAKNKGNKGVGSSKGEIPERQDEIPTPSTQRQRAVNHGVPRWIFRSVEVTARYQFAFESDESSERIQLLAALLMIRSHSFLLLEKFKAWAHSTGPALTKFLSILDPD